MKFAACIGNQHLAIRVTPFFDTREAARIAGNSVDNGSSWVRGCSNWEEHMRWNQERIGNYAQCPVQE